MDVSVLVPARADVRRLVATLEALEATSSVHEWELVLALTPSASADCRALVAALEGNVVVVETGDDWSTEAAGAATGRLVAALSDGLVPASDWLDPLVEALDGDEAVAEVQPLLTASDDVIHAGVVDVAGVPTVVGVGLWGATDPAVATTLSLAAVCPDAHLRRAHPSTSERRLLVPSAVVDASAVDLGEAPERGHVDLVAHRRSLAAGGVLAIPSAGRLQLGFEDLLQRASAAGRLVVVWDEPGAPSDGGIGASLRTAGAVWFPAEPAADPPDDPRHRSAWRRAHRPGAEALAAQLQPEAVIFGDPGVAEQWADAVGSFAPGATRIVCVDAVPPPASTPRAAEIRRRMVHALTRADRVLTEEPVALVAALDLEDVCSFADPVDDVLAPAAPVKPQVPTFAPGRPVVAGRTSVVIPVWNRLDLTEACVASIRTHSPRDTEVIVVDNGSTDGTTEWLARQDDLVVIANAENLGFAAACNQGLEAATGDVVVLLNNDTRVPRRWIDGLRAPLDADASVGATGPRSNSVSGPQLTTDVRYDSRSGFARVAEDWRRARRGRTWDADRLVGFCIALRREAVDRVGGLDEAFGQGNFEDDDLCLRLRADGWRLVVADEVLIHHVGSASFGEGLFAAMGRARRVFDHKHGPDALGRLDTPVLTAFLIVRDEEELLPDCLRSLQRAVDRIVVGDTGSTDRTRVLAESFGCTVVDVPWTDDFAAARNAVLEHVTTPWALMIDADERLVGDGAPGLRDRLTRADEDLFQVRIVSPVSESGTEWEHRAARVMRTDRFRYQGRLHELPVCTGDAAPLVGTVDGLWLLHEGYRDDLRAERDKVARNERIARAFYESDEGDPWYRAFVYARSAVLAADRRRVYLECAELTLDATSGTGLAIDRYRGEALAGAAYAALDLGEPDEALTLAERALAVSDRHAQARFVRGVALRLLGRPDEAVEELEGLIEDGPAGCELTADSRWHAVHGPAELARARAVAPSAGSADVLDALRAAASAAPGDFDDWPALVTAERATDAEGWPARVASLAAPAPTRLLASFSELGTDVLGPLADALVAVGVPAAAVGLPVLRLPEDAPGAEHVIETWTARLASLDEASVSALATRVEEVRPSRALRLWEAAPPSTATAMGRVRCLVALGRMDDAVDALGQVSEADLSGRDRLVVAGLAGALGNVELAVRLLRDVQPGVDGVSTADVDAVLATLS